MKTLFLTTPFHPPLRPYKIRNLPKVAIFARGNKLLDIDAASLAAGVLESIANKPTLGAHLPKPAIRK